MKILCGIVTYNPDMNRLYENITAVSKQCHDIIIFDNASNNYFDIMNFASSNNIVLIKNDCNNGIAQALKYIMEYAVDSGYDWVLALDQDSVIQSGLIDKYKEYVDLPSVGILTCEIMDRNFVVCSNDISIRGFEEVEICITSGSFMNVEAYQKTAGYDPYLFIDKVDYDICYSFKDAGYNIIKIHFNGLLHEIGHGKNVSFLGINKTVYNHPSWRVYYMVRNAIYIGKKHNNRTILRKLIISELGRLVLIILFETDKWAKICQSIRGLKDGLRGLSDAQK